MFGRQNSLGAQMECPEEEESDDPLVHDIHTVHIYGDGTCTVVVIDNLNNSWKLPFLYVCCWENIRA